MKKIFTLFSIVGFIGLSAALTGCIKRGCTNPYAVNYDSSADKDDGSCGDCKTKVTIDNYDEYDYTIVSGLTGNQFSVDAWQVLNLTVTSKECVTYSVYDGTYYEGSFTFCPCNGDKTVDLDYY